MNVGAKDTRGGCGREIGKKSNHVDTLLLSFVIAFVIYKVSVRVQVS